MLGRVSRIVLVVVAMLITSSITWAQESSVVTTGTRIRIAELDSTGRRAGMVVTAGRDTIVLRPDHGEAVPIATSRITQLDVSQGIHGHALKGVAFGGLAGAGVGAIFGYSNAAQTGSEDDALEATFNSLAWAGIGAGVGMLVGGLIGGSHKTERWETVPTTRWRLTAGPRRTGFVLALSRSLDVMR
jgi:hypothetical protein